MKFRKILLVVSLLVGFTGLAQKEKPSLKIKQKYQEYFSLDREAFFLHLNKNVFIPGEDIWFSAYAFNPKKNTPNFETTNLYVKLLDENLKPYSTKTIFINKGKGSGYFKLDTLPAGSYRLVAHTNYMKNFSEDYYYHSEFTILQKDSVETTYESDKDFKYDLQLLPEGGHLIANTKNNLGVKLINEQGNGIEFSEAKVYDENKNVITSFKSNKFGIGKFQFNPTLNGKYFVELTTFYGEKIKQNIEKAEAIGLSMVTNNLLDDRLIIEVNTNSETLRSVEGKTFYLALHKNGIFESIPFQFSKDQISKNIRIGKEILASGINYLTIFDEDEKPLIERIVFNYQGLKEFDANAYLYRNDIDSLKINMSSSALKSVAHNLSVSILPSKTKAYQPNHNIKSAFLLLPYTKGKIENGDYYFTNIDRRTKYNLDLLLLTQGWSKYKWNKIFSNPPQLFHEREQGFTLEGKVNQSLDDDENQLLISSEESGLMEIIDLNKKEFKVDNLYIQDSTEISISLINAKKENLSKPKIYRVLKPQRKYETVDIPKYIKQAYFDSEISKIKIPQEFLRDIESLDSVYLITKSKEVEKKKREILSNETIIDENLAKSFIYITDYIATQGFRVNRTGFTDVSIVSNRSSNLSGFQSPLVYIDGMPLMDYGMILSTLRTSDVESIIINKSGLGYGMRANGGVIKIKTKTSYGTSKKVDQTQSFIADVGFSPDKEFYTPRYASYTSEIYENYGAIDWFPNLQLEDGQISFKIENTIQKSILLFIEGMTEEGDLISQTIEVEIKQ